jgi:hypothetical protein
MMRRTSSWKSTTPVMPSNATEPESFPCPNMPSLNDRREYPCYAEFRVMEIMERAGLSGSNALARAFELVVALVGLLRLYIIRVC